MDDFCWLTGPGLCGRLSFDVPVVEIFAMAVVSGVITAVTIHFSVKQARKETDRALEAAKAQSLRRAIGTLATEAQQLFDTADRNFPKKSGAFHTSSAEMHTSGLPHADDAVAWVNNLIAYTTALSADRKLSKGFIPADIPLMERDYNLPGQAVVRELFEWLDAPETYGAGFSSKSTALKEKAYEARRDMLRRTQTNAKSKATEGQAGEFDEEPLPDC